MIRYGDAARYRNEAPTINRKEGTTVAFSKMQALKPAHQFTNGPSRYFRYFASVLLEMRKTFASAAILSRPCQPGLSVRTQFLCRA